MVVLETQKGFPIIKFDDFYGNKCSLEISTIIDPHCIWFGRSEFPRMHLSAEQVKELIPHLEKFIENREL